MLRPFCPGGDYKLFDYPDGFAVVDNPPFSILSKIQAFYLDRGILFFLFAPALTLLSGRRNVMRTDHILCDAGIVYENGANVRTGFVTNMEPDYVIESAPELGRAVNEASDRAANRRNPKKHVPKYEYPDEVITSARCQWYAAHGTVFRVRRDQCAFISALDAQRAQGKSIFGGGLLLSEKAAAEKAAAEKAAAEKWQLSERERRMQALMSAGG